MMNYNIKIKNFPKGPSIKDVMLFVSFFSPSPTYNQASFVMPGIGKWNLLIPLLHDLIYGRPDISNETFANK